MSEAEVIDGKKAEGDGWTRRRSRIALEIEHIAIGLFAERGYANVTVTEVAEAAGVSRRTVTRYFPLKEDLLLALPRRRRASQLKAMSALADDPDPLDAMFEVFKSLAVVAADEMGHFASWSRAMQFVPELHEKAYGGRELADRLAEWVAKSLNVGLLDDPRPLVLSAALVAAVEGATHYWFNRGAVDDWQTLLTQVQDALRDGFKPRGEAPRGASA
ncbi:TetR/AcrR family transcriptional regulator [Streptomyces sp. NPDC007264]|uniref:TetR/AcrR family transcriptional regulator n=1 Tax=Streptomyces sp. NPDC007264 TaxID=3364777 RepID=UPI0036D9CB93